SAVLAERSKRAPGAVTATLEQMWQQLAASADINGAQTVVISGATGAEPATSEERACLSNHQELPIRATGTHIGHGVEPQLSMNIALAAIAAKHGTLFTPADGSGVEKVMTGPLRRAVVTGVGHWRGEGLALVEAVH